MMSRGERLRRGDGSDSSHSQVHLDAFEVSEDDDAALISEDLHRTPMLVSEGVRYCFIVICH